MGQAALLAVIAAAHSSLSQEDMHRLAPPCSGSQLKSPPAGIKGLAVIQRALSP